LLEVVHELLAGGLRVLDCPSHIAFGGLIAGLYYEIVDIACISHDRATHIIVTDGDALSE